MVTSTNMGRAGPWCQSAFTNLHPTSAPAAPRDWLSGGQNLSRVNGGHKNHVPASLSSAKSRYQSNCYVYSKWMCPVTIPSSPPQGICYVMNFVQSQWSPQFSWVHVWEKISLRRSHTSGMEIFKRLQLLQRSQLLYKGRKQNSTLSCNKYFTLILVLCGVNCTLSILPLAT